MTAGSGLSGTASRYFHRFELDSIRSRILLFAVLATLIPSGITAIVSYVQNRRALENRFSREVQSASTQAAREMDVWVKEHLQELRTLGASYEVSDPLEPSRRGSSAARGQVSQYVRSVRGRMLDYAELVVLDVDGQPIATTAKDMRPVRLPADWARSLKADNQLVGEPYWDSLSRGMQVVLAVPVTRLDGRLLGAFAARLPLIGLQQQLADLVSGTDTRLYLVQDDGTVVIGTSGLTGGTVARVPRGAVEKLSRNENSTTSYTNFTGEEAVGSWHRVPRLPWATLAEVPAATAFREVRHFRNIALTIVVGLLVVVSVVAYWLALVIVRPLDRLRRGAAEVAAGDLQVDLPPGGGGEVGYLTYVFNHMVARLRESRKELDHRNEMLQQQNEELARLSTTDALTGLQNRRHLSQRLSEEVNRGKRNKQTLTVLMFDVDNFKSYNDAFGHPAGDEVLKRVAQIIRESKREVDYAARYGGEEFCVLLPETSGDAAMQVAERIRSRVATEAFPNRNITVSIGVAEFPRNGETPEAIVAAADAALYQAKRAGRDRVIRAR